MYSKNRWKIPFLGTSLFFENWFAHLLKFNTVLSSEWKIYNKSLKLCKKVYVYVVVRVSVEQGRTRLTRLRTLRTKIFNYSFHAVLALICVPAKYQCCKAMVTVVVYKSSIKQREFKTFTSRLNIVFHLSTKTRLLYIRNLVHQSHLHNRISYHICFEWECIWVRQIRKKTADSGRKFLPDNLARHLRWDNRRICRIFAIREYNHRIHIDVHSPYTNLPNEKHYLYHVM